MSIQQIVEQLVVVSQPNIKPNFVSRQVALFNPDGSVLTVVQTTASMLLTGYTIAGASAAVSPTDSINIAIGKLEKRIALLEAA